ncbi:MAG: topoisomerase IV [Clostridia bacterium]|nr:topoisomerase IV [Clostridia bacterium]
MARKKREEPARIVEEHITDQPITETIEKNYMPYAMTVIVSRAIPEIDGFKPSHRKLLYTMYKMGLLKGDLTKSANVVGQTMHLNPHGDAAIYETLVRLTRGNESLLHPFVESKGSFGKQYSSDMAFAASRYTEVKLAPICAEIFGGIDKDAVDMVPNYDNTTTEPTLLPTSFPNVLVSNNKGIGVSMASNICSFNLAEICDGTIAVLKNPKTTTDRLLDIIKAPDFPGGANVIYDREQMRTIYETGVGSFKLRARYTFDKKENVIEILEIPYSTTIEAILKKIADLMKDGKLKDVTDFRDAIDKNGFKLTLDVRRGTDPDQLMAKLFRLTTLEDSFSCNFNVLINGSPRTLGVGGIIREWIAFRIGCLRRELTFELGKKRDKLHLLRALGKILLDIDRAIAIVRGTEKEADVVPRLMEGFGIDQIQAEYIAEIKLRHLNREYIIERIREIEGLQSEIADLEATISDELRLKARIVEQLKEVKKKYGKPRKTLLIYPEDIVEAPAVDVTENYGVLVLLTKEGYFKKITYQSLRGADEQKYKEGDSLRWSEDTENVAELLFFSDKGRAYKSRAADFASVKASSLGDFVPAKLGFDEGEGVIMMKALKEYPEKENVVFIFENGKGVRIPVSAYETKGNRRRLVGAYSETSPIVAAFYESKPAEVVLTSSDGRGILISSALIPKKTTRTSAGVTLMALKKNQKVTAAYFGEEAAKFADVPKIRKIKIPATGVPVEPAGEQITLG